jgi:hypothetical protein
MKAAKVGADITGNVQVPGDFSNLNNAETGASLPKR